MTTSAVPMVRVGRARVRSSHRRDAQWIHWMKRNTLISGLPAELDPQSWSVPPLLKGRGWSNYALEENQGHSGKGPATEMADLPDEGYSDGKLASLAVETLEDLAERKEPFFLAVGFYLRLSIRNHCPSQAHGAV